MIDTDKLRDWCVECRISFRLVDRSSSSNTCVHCIVGMHPSEFECCKCDKVIQIGDRFRRDGWSGNICQPCVQQHWYRRGTLLRCEHIASKNGAHYNVRDSWADEVQESLTWDED